MEIIAELRGLEQALADLQRLDTDSKAATKNAMTRIADKAFAYARDNAPVSPKASLLKALRKTKRKVKRNDRATSRPSPGGLRRSISRIIEADVDGVSVRLFVAANSEAGRYAARIHDEKGRTWHRRGPGTVAKGPQADDRFIARAVDHEGEFIQIVQDELVRAIGV